MSKQYPFPAEKYLLIGKVTRAHGLKGELKVVALSGQPENFLQYSRLALVAEDGRMTTTLNLSKVRTQGKYVVLKLDTIDTKNEADLTAGMCVLVLREDLPELEDDEFYLHELIGVTVKLYDSNRVIGVIETFFNNGAQDIVVVRDDSSEYYIPLVDDIIVSQDDKQIIIDPPPGLLEINDANN